MDSFIVWFLSNSDKKKFITSYCLLWISIYILVNNPEVIEFFKFLNPQIKLPDRKILSTEILSDVVKDIKIMFKDNLHFPF